MNEQVAKKSAVGPNFLFYDKDFTEKLEKDSCITVKEIRENGEGKAISSILDRAVTHSVRKRLLWMQSEYFKNNPDAENLPTVRLTYNNSDDCQVVHVYCRPFDGVSYFHIKDGRIYVGKGYSPFASEVEIDGTPSIDYCEKIVMSMRASTAINAIQKAHINNLIKYPWYAKKNTAVTKLDLFLPYYPDVSSIRSLKIMPSGDVNYTCIIGGVLVESKLDKDSFFGKEFLRYLSNNHQDDIVKEEVLDKLNGKIKISKMEEFFFEEETEKEPVLTAATKDIIGLEAVKELTSAKPAEEHIEDKSGEAEKSQASESSPVAEEIGKLAAEPIN